MPDKPSQPVGKPFVDSANRPDLTIDLDQKVGDMKLRDLAAVLGRLHPNKIEPEFKGQQPQPEKPLLQDSKQPKDAKDVKDHKEQKELKDHKEPKEHKDLADGKAGKDHKDFKEQIDHKGPKDIKDAIKEHKEFKEPKEFKEFKEPKELIHEKIQFKDTAPDKLIEQGPGDPGDPAQGSGGVEDVIKKKTGLDQQTIAADKTKK